MNLLAETSLFWANPLWDWVISLCLLSLTVVTILAVFGHRGTIQLSPQRQAAIATGHTDRKTVFENPIFGSVLWVLLSLAHRLNFPRAKAFLHRKLIAAGNPNYYTPEEYLALSMLLGLIIGLVLEIMHFAIVMQISLLVIGLGLLIGISLSILQINERASKRMQDIVRQLPYALDLISLAMGAGATFTEAVETIVRDADDDPKSPHFALNTELRAMLAEIELGAPRREAMQSMARRVPLESMQGLVASVIQAEELGTPLAKVLHDQATLLRMRRSTRAENRAAVASVRILVPCLLLVMAVILTVFGPAIIRGMRGGLI